jgi:hypothetical protein
MSYKICCSFGEIVDKITILEIKLKECKDEKQKQNISNEYYKLLVNIYDKQTDSQFQELYDELKNVNQQLWLLEDTIREKSRRKEYDSKYIDCAENIHIHNDARYNIKKKINIAYNSEIFEEKIYKSETASISEISEISEIKDNQNNTELCLYQDDTIPTEDKYLFGICSTCFETGDFIKSKNTLKSLCDKYKSFPVCVFVIKVFFSYNTIMNVFNEINEYAYQLKIFIDIINNGKNIHKFETSFVEEVNKMYGLHLLRQKKYRESHNYIKYLQAVTSPQHNISPSTMSFFKENDRYKTLLIYFGGGIGDIIMHARFIKYLCEIQQKNDNHIVFLIDDKLFWIFNYIYKNIYTHIHNIKILPFLMKNNLPHFDYHININMLFSYLKLDYSKIFVDYYMEFLPNSKITIDNILNTNKTNIIINWSGNKFCSHEKFNRGIYLQKLTNLFKKTNKYINWICVQKDILQEEKIFLNKHNVKCIGEKIDNDGDSFKDTLTVLKKADLVISTDTSLVHIAGTANIKCWCLLVKGCDWRWGDDETTKWYPNMKLIRQTKASNWNDVIDKVIDDLEKTYR